MTNALQRQNRVIVDMVWWISRGLSGLVLLAMGGFMLAYFIGGAEHAPRDLTAADRVGVAALAISLFGLLVAWKWEFIGVAITLSAVMVGAALNLQVVTSPLVLIPICAGLLLVSGWFRKGSTANGENPI